VSRDRCRELVNVGLSRVDLLHSLLQFQRLALRDHVGEPVRRVVEHHPVAEPLVNDVVESQFANQAT
jgi:hypothetical protein